LGVLEHEGGKVGRDLEKEYVEKGAHDEKQVLGSLPKRS